MAKGADRSRTGAAWECAQAASANLAELQALYRAAVARRDQWLRAYVTLCLYQPPSQDRGSDWYLELIPEPAVPGVLSASL